MRGERGRGGRREGGKEGRREERRKRREKQHTHVLMKWMGKIKKERAVHKLIGTCTVWFLPPTVLENHTLSWNLCKKGTLRPWMLFFMQVSFIRGYLVPFAHFSNSQLAPPLPSKNSRKKR